MAISVLQRNQGGDAASTGSVAVAFGVNTTVGSAIIAIGFVGTSVTANIKTPTDTQGNTYTLAANIDKNSPQSLGIKVWVAYGTAAAANTVTMTETGFVDCTLHVYEVSGLAANAAFDKYAWQGQASATSLDSTSTTTTAYANELIIGAFSNTHGATPPAWTVGAGFSNLISQSVTFCNSATEEKTVSATGTYNAVATLAANGDNELCAVFTFADTSTSGGLPKVINNYQFARADSGMSVTEKIR